MSPFQTWIETCISYIEVHGKESWLLDLALCNNSASVHCKPCCISQDQGRGKDIIECTPCWKIANSYYLTQRLYKIQRETIVWEVSFGAMMCPSLDPVSILFIAFVPLGFPLPFWLHASLSDPLIEKCSHSAGKSCYGNRHAESFARPFRYFKAIPQQIY